MVRLTNEQLRALLASESLVMMTPVRADALASMACEILALRAIADGCCVPESRIQSSVDGMARAARDENRKDVRS